MTFHSMHMGQGLERDLPGALPSPIDSETAVLLRAFLMESFERATSWEDLRGRLFAKGYTLGFRAGHLVVIDDRDHAICTGAMLGSPLSTLAARLGRPRIRSHLGGVEGQLRP